MREKREAKTEHQTFAMSQILGALTTPFTGLKNLSLTKGDQKEELVALAGVAQWIEHQPANHRVTGWIPSQGTCLGFGPGPQ